MITKLNDMKHSNLIYLLCITIFIVLLSGCVSLEEEIKVFEDGSATLRFELGVETEHFVVYEESIPEGYAFKDLFASLNNDVNITAIEFDRYTRDDRTWDSVEISVDDLMVAFGQARKIGPLTIDFDEEDEGYSFTQIIDVSNSTLIIPGVNLMDLSASSYVVRLETPQILSTNGVQPTVGKSNWTIPLGEILQEGSTAYLKANFSLIPYEGFFVPWEMYFPYVVVGFLSLSVFSILLVIIINTVGKKRDRGPTLKW